MALDLSKRQEKVKIVLTKRNMNNIPCQIKMAVDRSASMDDLYKKHVVQDLVERVLAIGLEVDMDGVIDVWAFHNKSFELKPASIKNIENYVDREIVKKITASGTEYAHVMEDIVKSSAPTPVGFFGKLFRKKSLSDPALAIFITDGDTFDKSYAEAVIKSSQSKDLYWMLIGIGNSDFSFIKHLGDKYPNCGYLGIRDITKIDDEDLFDGILNDECAEWLQKFNK